MPAYAILLVFIGGGVGSVVRFAIGQVLEAHTLRFPWATLVANVLACLILGFLWGLQLHQESSDTRKWLLATGFCGGFSTFSTFTADTWQLLSTGETTRALVNVALNLTICFLSFILGMKVTS